MARVVSALLFLTVSSLGCADQDAPETGVAAIEDERKLSSLTTDESELVCAWMDEQASAFLPSAKDPMACVVQTREPQVEARDLARKQRTSTGRSEGCAAQHNCPATLAQVRRCVPALFAEMGRRHCAFARADASELDDLVLEIAACKGVARCAYTR